MKTLKTQTGQKGRSGMLIILEKKAPMNDLSIIMLACIL